MISWHFRHFLLLIVALIINGNAYAGFVCYDEKYFPSVSKLKETENGIEAQLGGSFSEQLSVYPEKKEISKMYIGTSVEKSHREYIKKYNENRKPYLSWHSPVISLGKEEIWNSHGLKKCRTCPSENRELPEGGGCPVSIPNWPVLTRDSCEEGGYCVSSNTELNRKIWSDPWFSEEPSSCDVRENFTWFGINFYAAEGLYGYGGLGRYDTKTELVEVRRIRELYNTQIDKVVWDGKYLWAATANRHECSGQPPALGLVRYEWNNDMFETYEGSITGPCGFIIHDLLWAKNSLWVATDVGMSRWNSATDSWTHYMPERDSGSDEIVRTGNCNDFYTEILDKLPKDESWWGASRSYYEVFYKYLERFRPDFIKSYQQQ